MSVRKLRLLVHKDTAPESVEKCVRRIQTKLIHEPREVEVVVWDGTTPLSDYAQEDIRVYANTDVQAAQESNEEVREWALHWKPVQAAKKERGRVIPLFHYANNGVVHPLRKERK